MASLTATIAWTDTGINVYGCVKQLFLLKKANRQLKVILSIGGASWSTQFATVASEQQSRELFADSSVTLMKDWGFDGIDIDWEFPQNTVEAADYVLLLQAVRRRLDAYAAEHAPSYHFQLSIASSAGSEKYKRLDLKAVSDIVDCFYLMGYDYSGSWSAITGHQANLYPSAAVAESTPFSTDDAISDYLDAGVPSYKIILGAAYSWDPLSQELISYDSPSSVRNKAAFIKAKGLGGAMFWEASADRTGNTSLIGTSYECLAKDSGIDLQKNLLDYTDSRYANLAGRMVTNSTHST
ncbi:putative endochitinase [Colletotrichum sublineola]|uniref:chitinase n=1 Tax=Colletotrichum sublineola TaxID=1173701 RepID=A0A066XG81_COLSU|nr:putative endochitinase [Colletotrichum sublineola]